MEIHKWNSQLFEVIDIAFNPCVGADLASSKTVFDRARPFEDDQTMSGVD